MTELIPHWFVIVLLVNALIAFVYAMFCLIRGEKALKSWLIRSIIMLLCPVAGVCYFFISWLMYKLVFQKPVDLSDVVFSKERVESASRANEELERNFVPLEEAIAVTDRKNLRELMLNIVRGDYEQSLATIALALDSEDSETSHYAASVLQESLNDFRTGVQREYQRVVDNLDHLDPEKDPEAVSEADAASLIEFMDEMLQKRVFTNLEQKHFTDMMDAVAEKLYHSQRFHMDAGMLEEITLRLLEVADYEKCEKWSLRIVELYPDTLGAFTTRLKLYFSNGERDKFFEVLGQLKRSEVVIDRETLDLIRAFS